MPASVVVVALMDALEESELERLLLAAVLMVVYTLEDEELVELARTVVLESEELAMLAESVALEYEELVMLAESVELEYEELAMLAEMDALEDEETVLLEALTASRYCWFTANAMPGAESME